jgi:hypothetical protein
MYDTGVGVSSVTLGNGKSKSFINGALPIFQPVYLPCAEETRRLTQSSMGWCRAS